MFAERDHIHTLLYLYNGMISRDADGVPAELALDHPFAALGAVVVERAADDDPPHARAPGRLAGGAGAQLPGRAHAGRRPRDPAGHRGRRAPRAPALVRRPRARPVVGRGRRLRRRGRGVRQGPVRWASPFIPTVPGTDRYTDQLW